MRKQVPWETILEIVERFPEGTSLEEVSLALDPLIPRRTLQRWLAELVQEKKLTVLGEARARKYLLVHSHQSRQPSVPSPIPLSKPAAQILVKISRPLPERPPTDYNREFLEKYRPNRTYYLPEDLRNQLHAMGGSEEGKYPAGTYAKEIFQRLLIDLSWNSSRLEGNTYSLLETERLLNHGNVAVGKNQKETQMILNHKEAIEFIVQSAEQIRINRYSIFSLHALLSDNLLPNPAASGRLRTFSVGITHSTYRPLAIPQVIEECFDLLIAKADLIQDPFEQAFFLMVHISYLQAFEDVNKRTARLAANIPLIRNNLCPLSFIDVPQDLYINGLLAVYELNRIEILRDVFTWAYGRSCALYAKTKKETGEPDPFHMRYWTPIKQSVREIVVRVLDKTQAIKFIRQQAGVAIPEQDQPRFIEMVERELQSLHEGNVARFKLQPSEYEAWKKTWL